MSPRRNAAGVLALALVCAPWPTASAQQASRLLPPPVELALASVVVDLGDAGDCHVNVACPKGRGWEDQANATVRITIGGGRSCTGVLVNNVRQDATPFLLTAGHCGDLRQARFQFNWKRPRCKGGKPQAPDDRLQGCEVVVADEVLDFQLVRLSESIPASYTPYFAGWDRTGQVPASTTSLHHPAGDAMKISIDDDPPAEAETHWQIVRWDTGSTEIGSSGGPLYSPEHLLVGVLNRGAANCDRPQNDLFVRMDAIWSFVAPALDIDGTGVERLPGLDPLASPPAPFGAPTLVPDRVPPLVPGTAQTILVEGTGMTRATTLDLDGEALPSAAFSLFSHSRLTLDLPPTSIGAHVLTVRGGDASHDVPLEVVEAAGPILQAGTGDPGNQVSTFAGIDLTLAGRVGHELVYYWSTVESDGPEPPGIEPHGRVTIPAAGWVQEHLELPKPLIRKTVHVRAFCRSCEGDLSAASNPQSFYVAL